ncbi:MAG: protein kinase, partial [Myxococcales bacterium]|nr:protein kinase [Myxococcales bacterium]
DVFSAGIILHEMLTTEKLFRGDTEFALMEKVRKAEVPLPSEFNRRVTGELDAIVCKALARDVADRYQSAAQLAADLDALIGSYRFDPKELRQFMRQQFRKEYAKEVEDTQLALDASAASTSMTVAVSTPTPARNVPTADMPPVIVGTPGDSSPEIAVTAERPGNRADKRGGFWGNLFKKRK